MQSHGKFLPYALLIFLLLSPARFAAANMDDCLQKEADSGEWVKARGCHSSSKSWAVAALEDIWTFDYLNSEDHFRRIKEAYFTDDAWQEFQAALTRSRILDMLSYHQSGVYGVRRFNQDVTTQEDIVEDDKAVASFSVPLSLIYGPVQGNGSVKRADSVTVHLDISGPMNFDKKLVSDIQTSSEESFTKQYNFKITSYKISADTK